MAVQSLLFRKDEGWTTRNAKRWAQSHGYRSADVDVTDRYVRFRQFDPGKSTVKRTITLGRGIRAVVAREESMATKKAPKRRSRRAGASKKKTVASPSKHARRSKASKKGWAHRREKARARSVAAKRGSRRRVREGTQQVKARRRRKSSAPYLMESSRRRRRSVGEAWRGDPAGHRKAAKKGWRRRKARRGAREAASTAVSEGRRHRSRGRRRSSHRTPKLFEVGAVGTQSRGMYGAEFAATILFGGLGYAVADGVDRLLATYNPAGTAPTDKHKFTSDGAGTLANTLNVAASPSLARIAVGFGLTAAPAIASFFTEHPFLRHSLEGAAVGAGISVFKTFWNNVVMGAWLGPKDTTTAALQHSTIARLYPSEVVAAANLRANQNHATGVTFGALSGATGEAPAAGVGAPSNDVGPFALAGSSPYMDVAQALRCQAGLCDEHEAAAAAAAAAVPPPPPAPPAGPPTDHQVHHSQRHQETGAYAWGPGASRFPTVAQVWEHESHQPHHGGGHPHGHLHGTNSPAAPGWAGLGDWRTQNWHRNEWDRRRQWELSRGGFPAWSGDNWHRLERERRRQWELQHGAVFGIGDAPVQDALVQAANAIVAALPGTPPGAAQAAALTTIHHPHDVVAALQRALPGVPLEALQQVAPALQGHLHHLHGLYIPVHHAHPGAPADASASSPPPPLPPAADASAPPGPPPPDTTGVPGGPPPPPPAPTGVSGHPNRMPGPPPGRPHPGPPQGRPPGPASTPHQDEACGCVGENNPFLGYLGEAEEETLFKVA